jgi:hypothetical protein
MNLPVHSDNLKFTLSKRHGEFHELSHVTLLKYGCNAMGI